uniref:Putative g-protein coupled receptor n=1 Tax=Schistosoma mansoni TaxID=6183 RepID=A0A3Q0KPP0_SCHMA
MVATLPMPVAAIYEISEDWWLGEALCDFWVCSDVLCCTASILHLVGIALDRYWAVTNAEYIRRRTGRRIGIMIGIFWFLSVLISIPARFHTTRSYNYGSYTSDLNLNEPPSCRINQEHGYTVFSNIGAFYMPMIFIIGIYARIYQVARARIRRSAFKQSGTSNLCMSQWKQPQSKQQQQHRQYSFRHHLNTCWCYCCRDSKNRNSVKLVPARNNPYLNSNNNNSNNNTNQENPSSSQVADTDCTMIGRKTITLTEIPTIVMMNNKHNINHNNCINQFNNIKVSTIPYVDDMETKSNYYQSNDNMNKNPNYTKPILLHYCHKQHSINTDYTLNVYKQIQRFNSFNDLNYIINFDPFKQTLLSKYRYSAPSILIHLNNSSTFFTEITNSNSQSIESSIEHTNSIIWSSSSSSSTSSSSPLPSTPSSSFSEFSSYRQQNHHHHHHRHQHNHNLHHRIHHHSHKRLHKSNKNHKRNGLKQSSKVQNHYLNRLKCFYPCCSCTSTSSNHHPKSYPVNQLNLIQDKNSIINHRKHLSYCCIDKHKNYTSDYVTSSNNNELYLQSIDPTSKLSHSYYKQNTISPTITTTTIINYTNNSSKNNMRTGNDISMKPSKNQLNLRKKLCHMFNLHGNNNNNNVYNNNKHIVTQSTSNLPSNINPDTMTLTTTNQNNNNIKMQLLTPTTLTTSLTLKDDDITITSNLIPIQQTQVNRERLEAKRERKAILTLAIITGCFLLCWLPFFIVALISPFINNLNITKFGQSMILWLGYSNSLLNPIIYTIFSPDFRNAFRKILFGRYNLRSLSR